MLLLKLIFTVIVLCVAPVRAEKLVGGIINRDTRWNADEGPYILAGDLLICRNTRLTITPGTVIIVRKPPRVDTAAPQINQFDSVTSSIKVEGTLLCIGRRENRIIFSPDSAATTTPSWYGIVLHQADDQFTEIAHTDIAGAFCGIAIENCAPTIRNTVLEFNHIGIVCTERADARIYNMVITANTAAGIRIEQSNPSIRNSIIAFNRNNGLWCDGTSRIVITNNCIYGNNDGNFLDCDPELGQLKKGNRKGKHLDRYGNVMQNPTFSGSVAETQAVKQDINQPTDTAHIINRTIAAILHPPKKHTIEQPGTSPSGHRYELSRYSPCIDAGNPSAKYKDQDGSRNDIGIWGGPEYRTEK